jgi:hypothetical protein
MRNDKNFLLDISINKTLSLTCEGLRLVFGDVYCSNENIRRKSLLIFKLFVGNYLFDFNDTGDFEVVNVK